MKILCKSKIILTLLFVYILSLPALADSPLTSTQFYKAYMDIPEVVKAEGVGMEKWIFEFLTNSEEPLENRMAMINAMGWNINGNNNGKIFIVLMADKLDRNVKDLKIEDLSGEELLCLSYLLALDDYFKLGPASVTGGELETADALTLLERGLEKSPDDFTVNFIGSLITAQYLFDYDWGKVYTVVKDAVDSDLEKNMRESAINIVMDYINLYKEYNDYNEILDRALTFEPLREITAEYEVYNINFSPDGKEIITTSGNETAVRIWDSNTGEMKKSIDCGEFTDCTVFSPDGKWILIANWTPQVCIYSSKDYRPIKKLNFPCRVMDIAINPQGNEIAFSRFDGNIEIYSTGTWKRMKIFPAHSEYVATVDYSCNGKYLLTAGYDYTVKLWDVTENYGLLYEVAEFNDGTFAYFLPEDRGILVRDYASYVKVLDNNNGEVIWEQSIAGTVHDVSSSPSGKIIAAATEFGAVYLWNLEENTPPLIFQAHKDQVLGVRWSPDGSELFTCGLDKKWKVWDGEMLKEELID